MRIGLDFGGMKGVFGLCEGGNGIASQLYRSEDQREDLYQERSWCMIVGAIHGILLFRVSLSDDCRDDLQHVDTIDSDTDSSLQYDWGLAGRIWWLHFANSAIDRVGCWNAVLGKRNVAIVGRYMLFLHQRIISRSSSFLSELLHYFGPYI